jgi:predicted enzyme related to lactoylglutathione lyase
MDGADDLGDRVRPAIREACGHTVGMAVTEFHPILYVDDQYAERDFYALFGFTTIYEGPEFPGFLAVRSGSATIGLSHRDDLSVEPVDRGVRWQFIVEDVDDVVAVCEANSVACEVIVEEGGTTHRGRIAKVTSPNGIRVWFEGPNELQ